MKPLGLRAGHRRTASMFRMLDGAAKLSVDVPRVFTASFEVFGSAPIVEQCYRPRN